MKMLFGEQPRWRVSASAIHNKSLGIASAPLKRIDQVQFAWYINNTA